MSRALPGITREVDNIAQAALRGGWAVSLTPGGHVCFRSPDPRQPLVIGPATTRKPRAIRNLRAQLRRSGLCLWPIDR